MRTPTWFILLVVCAGLVGVTHSLSRRAAAQLEPPARKLAVVVSRELGVRNIDLGTLQRAFRGETTELGGKRLIPFNYPPADPVRRSFDQQVLSMSPERTGRYWVDRRIRGQGQPPRQVPNAAMVLALVQNLPGAIGYVPAGTLHDKVQVLSIDGRSYTDAGYPFEAPFGGLTQPR